MLKKYCGLLAPANAFFFLGCLAGIASEKAELQVPNIIRVQSGTETGLPLNIAVSTALYTQTMVVIRGIPSSVSLTEGRLFPSGVWALKVSAAGSARFVTTSNSTEDTPLIVSLVTLEGANLGNATTQLVIAPATTTMPKPAGALAGGWTTGMGSPPQAEAATGATQTPARRPAPTEKDEARIVLYPPDVEKILKLMERGDQHLLEGKIASARRFYQLATEMGWPEGALAIARTYDADHLGRFPILGGITPDETLARDWYDRARQLSMRVQMRDRQFSGTQ